jgi:IS4 transposase
MCGAKTHIVYDPDADLPVYSIVTPARTTDLTAIRQMPLEAGATYVFDLGYYDYGWWAALHEADCRIVTRFKSHTPLKLESERTVPVTFGEGAAILSDRIGYLPERQASRRKNPFHDKVREVRVTIGTGRTLRILTNDLDASAQDIADLYKRRWMIELFFRWVKQSLKLRHFLGTSENAVRIQIAVALIAFVLLRLAQASQDIIESPLTFARLVRSNLTHRRRVDQLLSPPGDQQQRQAEQRRKPRPQQAPAAGNLQHLA